MSQGYTPSLGEDPERFLGSCRGKVRHSSKAVALAAVRRLIQRGDAYAPSFLGVYKCSSKGCGKWHVGHKFWRDADA